MPEHQPAILAPLPAAAHYLTFTLSAQAEPAVVRAVLQAEVDGRRTLAGLGMRLVERLGVQAPTLRPFPELAAAVPIPATHGDLWLWLRGDDRGELLLQSHRLCQLLAPHLALRDSTDAFLHDGGRDLTGYEDGTENPKDAKALAAAVATDGSSIVAVQRWRHDFAALRALSERETDLRIGRQRSDNEELADAPPSAHVKRTAQESFDPEAFVLRRSMPWSSGENGGLLFVAFGHTADAFEAQLRRMIGLEDGIVDGLFDFSLPKTGAYFWCPPLGPDGRLAI